MTVLLFFEFDPTIFYAMFSWWFSSMVVLGAEGILTKGEEIGQKAQMGGEESMGLTYGKKRS
jgi:hypothetical protein